MSMYVLIWYIYLCLCMYLYGMFYAFAGDVWVISQSLQFDLKGHTFIAKSAFYGPNSEGELELVPLAG